MKYIFNSLGSNYSISFALHALLYFFIVPPKDTVIQRLDAQIKQLFPDFESGPHYFYKGRDALEFALVSLGVTEEEPVLTQAFTCHALEASIRRAGAVPAYMDIDLDTLNPSVETVAAAYKKNPKARIVIIQHTLGIPAPIKKIKKWCDTHGLIVIEDVAQAIGGHDTDKVLLGSYADAVILSFGRDKIIDAISGGACLFRTKPKAFKNENYQVLTTKRFRRDHFYPLLTYCIRSLYPVFIGKILLYIARIFQLIQSPVKARFDYITALPASLAALAVSQFQCLELQLQHRKKIAQIYTDYLHKFCPVAAERIQTGSNLRFPICVPNPEKLIADLVKQHIYIQDRWYRNPVDSGALRYFSKYRPGSCPNAEQLAQTIVNLPTHQNISEIQAKFIAQTITAYYAHAEEQD